MNTDTGLIEQLERFGLTESEAAVYLALVDRGRAKPSELASETDISTSYVYQIAEGLEQEGLAVVDDHQTPTTIRANPPDESLSSLMDEMENTLSAVQRRFSQPTNDAGSLETIQSRQTALKRLRSHIENTESELFLSLPYETTVDVADTLRDAVDRGVFVLLAVAADDDEISGADLDGVATAIRQWVRGMNVYLVSDMNQGLVAPSAVFGWAHGGSEAVSFNHFAIAVAVEAAFLGAIWRASEEVMLQSPSDEPRTHQSMRPAVYDATVRLRAGRTVRAEVTARPTLSEDILVGSQEVSPSWDDRPERTLTGTVVETRQNLVDPLTSDFALENGIVLETDEGRITVGGQGAFLEDYVAEEITLFEE